MKVVKCIWQYHDKYEELKPAFDYFRFVANQAIRIGIEKNVTSKFGLHYELYHKLRSDLYCKILYGAFECAASNLKRYKKIKRKKSTAKIPYIHRPYLILENHSYKIENDMIRIPVRPRQYVLIKLNHYIIKQIKNFKLGSIILNENKLIITYSNTVTRQEPLGFVGVDRNLDNVTTCNTDKNIIVYNMSKVPEITQKYRRVKSNFKRNDARIRRRIFQKYGVKQRHKVQNILHKISQKITTQNNGIIMEDIKGIGRLYRKGNGHGRNYRAKMNSWPFYELQRQIEYKARWLGLPVTYVNAAGTSSKCAECGSKMIPEEHRMLFCSKCSVKVDRDVNAAKNILTRGTKVVPIGVASEAMVEGSHKVILKVDATQLAQKIMR